MYDRQESRFNSNIRSVRVSRQEHLQQLALEELRKRFTASQRRRMLETEKMQNLELARIRLSKIDGSSEIKNSLENQRNAMIHKILVEKLKKEGNSEDLNTTPGIKLKYP